MLYEVITILFIHADIATMAQGRYNSIKDGAIGVTQGKIQWIGPFDKLQMERRPFSSHPIADEIIDCAGKWILPGFVDCHT